jgi:hypothetical protein
MTISQIRKQIDIRDAASVLLALCPGGEAISDRVSVDQDWSEGTTTITIDDAEIVVDGQSVTAREFSSLPGVRVGPGW